MPLYDVKCNFCQETTEIFSSVRDRNQHLCSTCSGPLLVEITNNAPVVHLFHAGFYEHVSPQGVWAETPQQLQDACNAGGTVSEYLVDSIHRVHVDQSIHEEKEHERQKKLAARDERRLNQRERA